MARYYFGWVFLAPCSTYIIPTRGPCAAILMETINHNYYIIMLYFHSDKTSADLCRLWTATVKRIDHCRSIRSSCSIWCWPTRTSTFSCSRDGSFQKSRCCNGNVVNWVAWTNKREAAHVYVDIIRRTTWSGWPALLFINSSLLLQQAAPRAVY